MKKCAIGVATVLLFGLTGCLPGGRSTGDLAVTAVDPVRYCGVWYEIARLPTRFEQGLIHVTATYEQQPDGRIKVINRGWKDGALREITGWAREAEPGKGIGEWEVSFFRPFYGKYRILHLADDGSLAMVTSGTRDYLWILARTPAVPEAQLEQVLAMAKQMGFAVDLLEYPQQDAAKTPL